MKLTWRRGAKDLHWLLHDESRHNMNNRALITLPGYLFWQGTFDTTIINAFVWSDKENDWVHDPDAPTELEECQAYMAMRVRMGDTP